MLRPNLVLLALGLLLASAFAPLGGRAYPAIYPGDFDQARAHAKERNAVIVLGVIQENEVTNDEFKDRVWQHADFQNATADTITLLVNDGKHRSTKITEELPNGETIEREVCSSFHTDSCGVHERLWNLAYQEFNIDGDMRTPQLIVLLPDGKEHGRLIDEQNLATNLKLIAKAKEAAGPSLSAKALGIVKRESDIAAQHAGAGRHGAAWHAWQRVLAETRAGPFHSVAQAGVEAALAGYRAAVEDAEARLEAGEIVDGWSRLVELGEEWAGSTLEKEHAKRLRQVERDKRYKEVIEAHRRELEAEQLWREIEALINADEESKAERLAAKLVRKYGETKAAERARREFPDLETR
ncbi:MAG: hypothetical protein WD226_14350 [Planctomycetota bacterium]